jgi:hypothetical protein
MNNENPPYHGTGFESDELPTEQVEDVVVALDEALQHCRLHPEDSSCDCIDLHSRICHTEIKNLFEHYDRHEILTIDDVKNSIAIVLAQLESEIADDESDEFMKQGYQLLRTRGEEIDRATRRYVQTISKFFHIKKQQFRLDVEDFKAKFQEIDQVRRIAHNGLIETLTIYTKTVGDLKRYGALGDIEIEQWHTSDRFTSDEDTKSRVFVFAPEVLQNRELVKDWAVSAHMSQRLHEIEELQKGAQQEVLGAENEEG